jgi:hypothetical protein
MEVQGERMCNSYSFITSALDGSEWLASRPGCALPPGKGPPVPIVQQAGWAPEPVWAQRLEKKSVPLPGIEPRSPGRPVRSQTLCWLSYTAPEETIHVHYSKLTNRFGRNLGWGRECWLPPKYRSKRPYNFSRAVHEAWILTEGLSWVYSVAPSIFQKLGLHRFLPCPFHLNIPSGVVVSYWHCRSISDKWDFRFSRRRMWIWQPSRYRGVWCRRSLPTTQKCLLRLLAGRLSSVRCTWSALPLSS